MYSNFFICLNKNHAAADNMVERFGPFDDDKCTLCGCTVISETANRDLRKDFVIVCPDCFGEAIKETGATMKDVFKDSVLVTGGAEYEIKDAVEGKNQS